MEKEKGFGIGELLIILLLATVMGLIFYWITIKKVDQKLANLNVQIYSPIPNITYTPVPTQTAYPTPTANPRSNTSSDYYTKGGLYIKNTGTPGIKGTVRLGSTPLANVAIPIKPAGTDIGTTVYTDTNGRFSIELAPGQYEIGPVREPSSGAIASAVVLTVRENQWTQANISFK